MKNISLDPSIIYYSQTSITVKKEHIKLALQFKKNGWNDKYALQVVCFDKNFVSLDNRRLLLAHATDVKEVKCKVHMSDQSDEDLKSVILRFQGQINDNVSNKRINKEKGFQLLGIVSSIKNWGDVISYRVSQQDNNWSENGADGFSQMRQIFGKKDLKKKGKIDLAKISPKWKPKQYSQNQRTQYKELDLDSICASQYTS